MVKLVMERQTLVFMDRVVLVVAVVDAEQEVNQNIYLFIRMQ